MKRKIFVLAAACLVFSKAAFAHRIDEYLQATIFSLEANRVHASMRLIPGVLVAPSIIAAIDTNQDGVFSDQEERAYAARVLGDLSLSADGQTAKPELDAWSFPEASQLREGLGEISIQYHVRLPQTGRPGRSFMVENHHLNSRSVYLMNVEVPQDPRLRIGAQKRNQQQSTYEVDYEQLSAGEAASVATPGAGAWLGADEFSSLFRLGMRHIAEGTDHLLFLLVLLLPAPLCVVGWRWGSAVGVRRSLLHILGIVTAFTLGHSITLTVASMGLVRVPGRPVEVLIAVSILISAVHALRPIFPGKEAWIAAFFGLIHGLAFATTLDRLGLSRWHRVAGILAFNLGIETMQVVVVAAILPSLLLMSRTRFYPLLRVGGALFACAASIAWIVERLLRVQTRVDDIVNVIARHGVVAATALLLASVACKYMPANRSAASTV